MKKLFSILAAGALLTACSSDEMTGPEVGTEQEVMISFQLPETISSRATGTNSALGGASNCSGEITFTAALYYNGTEIWRDNASAAIPNANAAVTFKPTLVIGETYKLVAYAQMDGVITDLTAQTEANAINDETVDAYYVSTDIVAEPAMSATLKRATAKLRIIANDFAAAEEQLGKKVEKVAIAYRQAQSTSLNPTTGEWADDATETEFGPAELVEYGNEGDAKTILVDYIPATAEGEIINIESVTVTFDDGTTYTKDLSTLDVPVKRNYLTTLKGDFFMSEMNLNVKIDDAFDGNAEEEHFAEVLANGGTYTMINDLALDEALTIPAGKDVVIDLNGHNLSIADESSNIAVEVMEGSSLTINGEGNVSTDLTLLYATYGELVINGGNHAADLEVVEVNGATAVAKIYGGYYEAATTYAGNSWILNKKDNTGATIEVYGGTFVGFNPADNVSENPAESFVAEGYKSVELQDGVWTVVLDNLAGDVTLAGDIEVASVVKVGAGMTLDGANHTMSMLKTDAQYALMPSGGTIKNLVIEGYNTRNENSKVIRGIYIQKPTENVVIDNVHISGVAYPLNTGTKSTVEGLTLTVTNSTLVGWSSFNGGFASATFENCVFSTSSYFDAATYPQWNNCVKPYITTTFKDCKFDKGFYIELTALVAGSTVELDNCTVDGTIVTADNIADLLIVNGEGIVW